MMKNFGKRIKRACEVRGITITELGEYVYSDFERHHYAYMNKLMNNSPQIKKIRVTRLCKKLDVDPNYIFGEKSVYDKEMGL